MNPEKEGARTQLLAVGLIALAAGCIAVGEMHNWIHMIDFANAFGGAGVGILTGQKLTQTTTKGGGDINNDTKPTSDITMTPLPSAAQQV